MAKSKKTREVLVSGVFTLVNPKKKQSPASGQVNGSTVAKRLAVGGDLRKDAHPTRLGHEPHFYSNEIVYIKGAEGEVWGDGHERRLKKWLGTPWKGAVRKECSVINGMPGKFLDEELLYQYQSGEDISGLLAMITKTWDVPPEAYDLHCSHKASKVGAIDQTVNNVHQFTMRRVLAPQEAPQEASPPDNSSPSSSSSPPNEDDEVGSSSSSSSSPPNEDDEDDEMGSDRD